jgi:hypothetical protein
MLLQEVIPTAPKPSRITRRYILAFLISIQIYKRNAKGGPSLYVAQNSSDDLAVFCAGIILKPLLLF